MAKQKDVIINFKGAEPVSGTRRYDRIPEATYFLKVKKAALVQTSTDKPAISLTLVVQRGEMKSKALGDMFVLQRKGMKDAIFGTQRLHGFMIACGIKRQKGKASSIQIAKALTGREVVAEVADSTIPATDSYAERITSAPQEYFKPGSKEAKASLKSARPSEEEDEGDEEDEEDEEEGEEDEGEEEDEEEDEEDEEEEEKPPKKSKKSKKSKAKKAKEEDEEDEDDEDDLYDEEEEDEDED